MRRAGGVSYIVGDADAAPSPRPRGLQIERVRVPRGAPTVATERKSRGLSPYRKH
jgi:hypothetical protein